MLAFAALVVAAVGAAFGLYAVVLITLSALAVALRVRGR
jgi:hypothetical protein